MAAPSMTFNATGNLLAAGTVAAGATATFNADFSTKFEGQIQFSATFGTVAATAGLQISVFPVVGSTGTVADNVAGAGSFTLAAVASTTQIMTIKVGPGKYSVSIKNLDASNSVTSVSATGATVDGIA
jgi:UDP-N-acetylglucosamine enolpyruvyl transferase